jgi:SAM-dependent methyltransferase
MTEKLKQHYTRSRDLVARARELLVAAGKNPDRLAVDDLLGLDELHVRGREATLDLATKLGLRPGLRVLDIGSGFGGPARRLASNFGVDVVGVDLMAEHVRLATALTASCGLADRVRFEVGDATRLPFADESFDIVWTQHAQMNIADKGRLFGEIHRVLRREGRVALYDILQGPGGAVVYPTPWAAHAGMSYLVTARDAKLLLADRDLALTHWSDVTALGRDWMEKRRIAAAERGEPPISLAALLGADHRRQLAILRRNLDESRCILIEMIALRLEKC